MKGGRHRSQLRRLGAMLVLLVAFPARGGEPVPKDRRKAALAMCHEKNPSGAKQLRQDHEKTGQPEILFDLGECHEQLGHQDQALKSYRDYLKLPLVLRIAEANARIESIEARQTAAQAQAVQPPRYVLVPSSQEAGVCRRKCTTTEVCTPTRGRARSNSPENNYPGWAMAQNRCLTKEFSCLSACPGAVVKPGKCPAAVTPPGPDCIEDRTPRVLPGPLTPAKF